MAAPDTPTMKEFLFKIGEPSGIEVYLKVTADSADEAVEIANEEIAEESESSHFYFRSRITDAFLNASPEFRVDKSMIVDEQPASRDVLLRAYHFLTERGYEYSGDEDDLWHDKEPQFRKPLWTEDGGGIYGFYLVAAHYEWNIEKYSFRVKAVLYPVGGARIVDGEGGLHYTVNFMDRQLYTTLDELPVMLEFYESKFMALITALRNADPMDGLPFDSEL